MTDAIAVIALLSAVALAAVSGWASAHTTVATECERLGAFYVNEKTFECKLKAMP